MSGSKLLRLCSLFLCLLLCLANFSVVANAAEDENLVDSNLSNWTDYGDNSDYFGSADVTYLGESVNKITVSSSNYAVILFDLTEFLKIGESYNFNFTLPTTDGANSSALESCQLSWALCDGSGDNVPTVGANVFEISINNDNKSKYLGTDITFEFTYTQGYKNTFLCLFIAPGDNLEVYEDLTLYVSNLSLERVVPESEKKLDGILGWLQDIWDKLSSIGDKLTDVWTNITASVTDLGDRISGFFSDLGATISTKFNELTNSFSEFISSLGDRISGFFDNLITNVKTFFEELPGKIFNYQIEEDENGNITGSNGSSDGSTGDDSSSTNNSLISISDFVYYKCDEPDDEFYFFGDNYLRLYQRSLKNGSGMGGIVQISTCPLEFEMDSTYKLSFDIKNFYCEKGVSYSYDCPYFEYRLLPNTGYKKILITGDGHYEYEFYFNTPGTLEYLRFGLPDVSYNECRIDISNLQLVKVTEDGSTGDDTDEEASSGPVSWFQFIINKFKGWFTGLGESIKGFFIKLVDDIKGLFIPPEGFFEEWKVTFDLMLSDNLGFIYQAPNFIIDIIEVVQEILQSDQEVNLVFPAVEFDIAGYHIELFKDTKVDFSFLEAGIWLTLYSMYKVMLYVIFALALIKYGISTWERTMAN